MVVPVNTAGATFNFKIMNRLPLDTYDYKPKAQKDYLGNYGWHFNKKACSIAVGMMKKKEGNSETRLDPWTKEQVDEMLRKYGITIENDNGYDKVYVANMCKADYYKRSVPDEQHAAMFIKDMLDDVDGADGDVMRCWYAKMVGKGIAIEWEDFL